jgi:hypothetical protein
MAVVLIGFFVAASSIFNKRILLMASQIHVAFFNGNCLLEIMAQSHPGDILQRKSRSPPRSPSFSFLEMLRGI